MYGIIVGSIVLIISIIMFIFDRINYHWSGYDKELNIFNIPLLILGSISIGLGIIILI